jgi:hypothetical protein
MQNNNEVYVQYGCGWSAPAGWRNFDASPTLRVERLPVVGRLYQKNKQRFPENVEYGDIVKGLPLPRNSCDGVYCSHILEHLSLQDFRTALTNTFKILKPNRTFRLVVPDLEVCCKRYLQDADTEAALRFLRDTCLGEETRPRTIPAVLRSWLGNSRHLWMWDFRSMAAELEAAGFAHIRRASFGDSGDSVFSQIEDRTRWDDCLGVECRKPTARELPVHQLAVSRN